MAMDGRDKSILITEFFVFLQIAQDLLNEFRNLPIVKAGFRYETTMAADMLARMRKRLKRQLGDSELEYWENLVCGIADDVENHIRSVRKSLYAELLQKISYDQIEAALQIGMIGGFVDVAMQVRKALSGRSDGNMEDAMRYLRYIDRHIGFRPLNKGVEPNYEKCKEYMVKMYKEIDEQIKKSIA